MAANKSRRRNYYINKDFQRTFSAYFLAFLLCAIVLIGALFLLMSRGTVTTAYLKDGICLKSTPSFFFLDFLLIGIIVSVVVGLGAAAAFIYLSHRMAGPLYNFEKSLGKITGGELNYKIKTRRNDQFGELREALNCFVETMDGRMTELKDETAALVGLLDKDIVDRDKLKKTVERLRYKLDYFKTSNKHG